MPSQTLETFLNLCKIKKSNICKQVSCPEQEFKIKLLILKTLKEISKMNLMKDGHFSMCFMIVS